MVDLVGIEPTTNRSTTELQAQKVFRNTHRCPSQRNIRWCRFHSNCTTTCLDHIPSHTEHNLHDSQCHDAFDEGRLVRYGESALWSAALEFHQDDNKSASFHYTDRVFINVQLLYQESQYPAHLARFAAFCPLLSDYGAFLQLALSWDGTS